MFFVNYKLLLWKFMMKWEELNDTKTSELKENFPSGDFPVSTDLFVIQITKYYLIVLGL